MKKIPFKKILDLENVWSKAESKVQDKDKVQDKVELRKFSPKFFFCKKPQSVMFDGKIVKENFPFKIILDLENFWSETESKTESRTKLDLKKFW